MIDSMKREIGWLQGDVKATIEEECLLGVEDLEDKFAQADWVNTEELVDKIQDADSEQYEELVRHQKNFMRRLCPR